MFGDPYRNNNVYYLNKPKVRSSYPVSFQTTSLKAQYQLRAGVFNFPKKSPANNNQKKNDFRQCTSKIRQIQKDVRLKDKTIMKNKKKAPLTIKAEKKSLSSAQYSNDVPNKTKTEAKIDSTFTESSCKPRDKPKMDFRNNPYRENPMKNSVSAQYYSDYSYSTYTYTNRENNSQNEYSESYHEAVKKQKQKQSSLSISDHLSSAVVEREPVNISLDSEEDINSGIKTDDNNSDIKIDNNSDAEVEHHESSDMQLSDMDSITATQDVAVDRCSPQPAQTKNLSVHNISEKSDSLKSSKKDEKEETLNDKPEFKEKEEPENDYSNDTEKISEIIISGDYTPDQDQIGSESDKNAENELNQKNEVNNNAVDDIQEEEELNESSSANKNENLENETDQINSNKNVKRRSVDPIDGHENHYNDSNVDSKNNNEMDNDPEDKYDDVNKRDAEEESPRFKALLEANQKLVSVVLKNQEAILNIVENEYTKKALEHLHEAVTLLESIEPK